VRRQPGPATRRDAALMQLKPPTGGAPIAGREG